MTLLFIHGAGFTGEAFSAQAETFAGSHAPSLPGHDCDGSGDSIAGFAEFVEAYVERNSLRDAVLCGHSMGGAVAMETALRGRIPLRGLVLIGSGARLRVAPAILQSLEDDFETAIAQISTHFFADPAPERIEWAVSQMRRVGRDQCLRDFRACNAFDALDRLGELSVPLLAITGEADVMTPPKFAQALADRVSGAEARILPGAGHFVMAEQPAVTNAQIRAFLSRIE